MGDQKNGEGGMYSRKYRSEIRVRLDMKRLRLSISKRWVIMCNLGKQNLRKQKRKRDGNIHMSVGFVEEDVDVRVARRETNRSCFR